MSERMKRAPAAESPREAKSGKRSARSHKALELVALRGKDVIGVRHLLEGGQAWIGEVAEALVRVPMAGFGGRPLVVGEVNEGTFTLRVAPCARARLHGADGIARILAGPQTIELHEGERAVVVLGAVQIRAQIATIAGSSKPLGLPSGALGWVAFAGAAYIAVLALCAALAPAPPQKAVPGMQRVHARWVERAAP